MWLALNYVAQVGPTPYNMNYNKLTTPAYYVTCTLAVEPRTTLRNSSLILSP